MPTPQDQEAAGTDVGKDWRWVAGLGALMLAGCPSACTTEESSRPFHLTGQVGSRGADFAAALYQTTGVRMEPRNRIRWANNGAVFDVMVEEIGRARASINIVMFIWRPGRASDRMIEALSERATRGVTCRVLVDPMGSGPFEKEVKPKLEAAGCEAHMFRPLPADENLARNHRKILVVDGKVAVTGGLAIQDEWLGEARNEKEWRDTNARIQGPVVAQLQQAFAENWQESTGELLPATDFPTLSQGQPGLDEAGGGWAGFVSSTANPEVTRAERLTQLMVKAAKERLWISQSYFTPNDALMRLLVERARAGVDVRVLTPGDKNDQPAITLLQRATYDTLLEAGVRIWEYQPSMMHAKTMLVDDRLVLVGSINYDALSFNLLEEGSLVLEDVKAARELEAFFLEDVKRAREVHAERAAR
ncbi:phospholipase D-like domain-containing protein [Corallococcus sp. BB11-1]|uniref:phospholipase D-like domain-containing protein n=1 Tax=Corallococcus sp. BB11-1 TaxID=2996783 RepID=UPI00226D79B8|nr:phospholipase D-like domain-containing protein [Corallococcus sp. BB11-1]MCY1030112.1 phospholipase D-like domain-containing protein [Corallococcus sp. BB11-1]